MNRPKVTVTNVGKNGQVGSEWHVKINSKWKTFTEAAWKASGIKYINEQLRKN